MPPPSNHCPKSEHGSLPVWLAALLAVRCQANEGGERHDIDWKCSSGRAFYTNGSEGTVHVQPFDVHVESGHTVIVSWLPGDTAYTVELFHPGFLAA